MLTISHGALSQSSTASAPKMLSVHFLPNTCSVLQQFLADVGAEFAELAGTTDLVSPTLLARLTATGLDNIEVFFRCFGLEEGKATKRYEAQGVKRVIMTPEIPLARVRYIKEPYAAVREQV